MDIKLLAGGSQLAGFDLAEVSSYGDPGAGQAQQAAQYQQRCDIAGVETVPGLLGDGIERRMPVFVGTEHEQQYLVILVEETEGRPVLALAAARGDGNIAALGIDAIRSPAT